MKYKSVIEGIVDAVFPPVCPVCGKALDYKNGVRLEICEKCRGKLEYIKEPRCLKCGKEIGQDELEYCQDCRQHKHVYTQGTAVYSYTDSIQQSIYRFKYKNKREYASFYAKEIDRLCEKQISRWNIDVIVPVPLHISKYRRRGYNQSSLIAVELGKLLDVFVDETLLIRERKTLPMKELGNAERIKNLESAFICSNDVLKYKNILLVDDIYTTGTTIDACAKELRNKGALNVFFVCLCIGKGF